MPRFFVAASNIFGGIAYINGENAEHARVLRLRPGETITVCDGNGTDYKCRISDMDGDELQAEIVNVLPSPGEANVDCTIFAAYAKGDRLETAIQKCVELGASKIVLFPSARCVSRPDEKTLFKKLQRWNKIAQEAAKQSQRGIIPTVCASVDFSAAIKSAASADLPLFFYEEEHQLGLKTAVLGKPGCKSISICVGPEGGFTPEEAEQAKIAGMYSVSLGPRILRCETAPIGALAAVMCLTGNMEPSSCEPSNK